MEWLIAILSPEGRVLGYRCALKNVSAEELLEGVSERAVAALEGPVELKEMVLYSRRIDGYLVTMAFQRRTPPLVVLVNMIEEAVRGSLVAGDVEGALERAADIMRVKMPPPDVATGLLDAVAEKALQLEFVKLGLSLRGEPQPMQASFLLLPYRVAGFEDGMKRAISAAFIGDLIDAYRLAISALAIEKRAVAAIAATYFGYLLSILPGRYPAPDVETLRGMLKVAPPENDVEAKLIEFLSLLVDGLDDYSSQKKAFDFLRREIDFLFRFLTSPDGNQFLRDILAYILITFEPSMLSVPKAEKLLFYVEQRSMLLGNMLRAALDKLRSFTIMIAKEVPWRDVVGQIRMLKTKYLNVKLDLQEFVKTYELNMAFRRARELLIGSFLNLMEYLRLIYWAMGMPDANYDDLKEFLPMALYEASEVLRMVMEAVPPVPMDSLADSAYFTALISRMVSEFEKEEAEVLLRNALAVADSVIELLEEGGRWYPALTLKLIQLLWAQSNLFVLVNDVSPLAVRAMKKHSQQILGAMRSVMEENPERYLMYRLMVLTVAASVVKFLDGVSREASEILDEIIETLADFARIGVFLPQLAVPLLDSCKHLLSRIEDESKRAWALATLRAFRDEVAREVISPILKRVLENVRID